LPPFVPDFPEHPTPSIGRLPPAPLLPFAIQFYSLTKTIPASFPPPSSLFAVRGFLIRGSPPFSLFFTRDSSGMGSPIYNSRSSCLPLCFLGRALLGSSSLSRPPCPREYFFAPELPCGRFSPSLLSLTRRVFSFRPVDSLARRMLLTPPPSLGWPESPDIVRYMPITPLEVSPAPFYHRLEYVFPCIVKLEYRPFFPSPPRNISVRFPPPS